MKFNKKFTTVVIVSMAALGVVGCEGKKEINNSPKETEQQHNLPKLGEEEIQKGIEDGTIERE
ncbi:hypothetical protein QMM58_09610 [Clostridioides difficile]|nr:hypothetical protein [Clostridioides difficile]